MQGKGACPVVAIALLRAVASVVVLVREQTRTYRLVLASGAAPANTTPLARPLRRWWPATIPALRQKHHGTLLRAGRI